MSFYRFNKLADAEWFFYVAFGIYFFKYLGGFKSVKLNFYKITYIKFNVYVVPALEIILFDINIKLFIRVSSIYNVIENIQKNNIYTILFAAYIPERI